MDTKPEPQRMRRCKGMATDKAELYPLDTELDIPVCSHGGE